MTKLVNLLHCGNAADFFEILEYLNRNVGGPARRSVIKALLVDLSLPLKHGGALGIEFFLKVFTNDNYGYACGSDVLLATAVENAELLNVDFFAEYHRGNVADKGNVTGLGQLSFGKSGTVDGVVVADMNVVGVFAEHVRSRRGNICEVFVFAACCRYGIGILLSFFVCLGREVAGKDVVSFAVYMDVEGKSFELSGSAALNKDDVVVLGDIHKFPEQTLGIVVDFVIVLRTMTHLHNRHSCSLVVQHLCCRFLQYFFWQNRRSR